MRFLPGAALLAALAAVGTPGNGAGGAPPESETALYRLSGPRPWLRVRAVENAGYRVALSSADGETLEARVVVDGRPLPDGQAFPVAPASVPEEFRSLVARPPDEDLDRLSRFLTRGAVSALEAVERIIGYTSRRIRYEHPGTRAETAASCLAQGRGSCVGRSLLAEELVARAGLPARQVTGILTASSPEELSPESRGFWASSIAGVRHRWIEVYVPGLGWVPSDPAGLANTVTARHLALSSAPDSEFGLSIVSRTAELKRPRLDLLGPGVALGRPRAAGSGAGDRGAHP